jgi:MFS family permease
MNADRHYWPLVLAAAAILMLLMGARQSLGLFIALDAATGIGVAGISLAFAVSQFVWGAAQPLCGALADRYGTRAVICGGALLTALGTAAIPFAR